MQQTGYQESWNTESWGQKRLVCPQFQIIKNSNLKCFDWLSVFKDLSWSPTTEPKTRNWLNWRQYSTSSAWLAGRNANQFRQSAMRSCAGYQGRSHQRCYSRIDSEQYHQQATIIIWFWDSLASWFYPRALQVLVAGNACGLVSLAFFLCVLAHVCSIFFNVRWEHCCHDGEDTQMWVSLSHTSVLWRWKIDRLPSVLGLWSLVSFNLASFLDIQSLYGRHPVTRNQLYKCF